MHFSGSLTPLEEAILIIGWIELTIKLQKRTKLAVKKQEIS